MVSTHYITWPFSFWIWRRRCLKFAWFWPFGALPLGPHGGHTYYLNNFESPTPKDDFCQVWLKSNNAFSRRRWKCKKFTDDGRKRTAIAHLSLRLRWALKKKHHWIYKKILCCPDHLNQVLRQLVIHVCFGITLEPYKHEHANFNPRCWPAVAGNIDAYMYMYVSHLLCRRDIISIIIMIIKITTIIIITIIIQNMKIMISTESPGINTIIHIICKCIMQFSFLTRWR